MSTPTAAWTKVRTAIASISKHQLRSFDGCKAIMLCTNGQYSDDPRQLNDYGVRVFELAVRGWWR